MEITASNYETEVLQSDQGVLVDYYADWCGPCVAVSPIVEKLAEKHGLKVAKINIDDEQDLARSAGVQSIPFIQLVKGGEVQAESLGAKPLGQLEKSLGL